MKLFSIILLVILMISLTKSMFFSFKNQRPQDYANTGPAFLLKEHLSGPILSEGLIYGPTGKMTNSFVAQMNGEWNGDTGTLSENFRYSNGKEQKRKWYLKIETNNTFTATADDIVGEAKGTISGSTIQLKYKIVLPEDAGGYTLNATDWMYLTEDGAIMNKSEMRMFGIKVAELIATMRPNPSASK